jgi:hypothetical protein
VLDHGVQLFNRHIAVNSDSIPMLLVHVIGRHYAAIYLYEKISAVWLTLKVPML